MHQISALGTQFWPIHSSSKIGPHCILHNIDGVGKTKKDSLGILDIIGDTTEQEVKTNYRKIARIYHPDKHIPDSTDMTPNQVEEYIKLVNNAYGFLRSNA